MKIDETMQAMVVKDGWSRKDPIIPSNPQPLTRDLVKEIALDIGKDLVAYIEVMYPDAIKTTSSTFKTSMRNHVYNQIMAAIEVNDEGEIIRRLEDRKKFRKEWVNQYRKIRKREQSK